MLSCFKLQFFFLNYCNLILVSEIQCSFSTDSLRVGKALLGVKDVISARLKKPEGFKGHPLFADDRSVDPLIDPVCQIRPDLSDVSLLTYNLLVTDFGRCGVLRRNVSTYLLIMIIINDTHKYKMFVGCIILCMSLLSELFPCTF